MTGGFECPGARRAPLAAHRPPLAVTVLLLAKADFTTAPSRRLGVDRVAALSDAGVKQFHGYGREPPSAGAV